MAPPGIAPVDVIREALIAYRGQWECWLRLMHTTDAERQLAQIKIALILLAPEMPAKYLNDGIGEHYWRKDCEVGAELLAFHHDPANQGKTFWPETYID